MIGRFRICAAWLASSLLLGACTYTGEASGPVERWFTWLSFVAGDDIRAGCREGVGDRYRFVYNAVYDQQIRAYELQAVPAGAEFSAKARAEAGRVDRFSLDDPLGPWALSESRTVVSDARAQEIVAALSRDAARVPPAGGRQVASTEFYWIVSACSAGRFRMWLFDQRRADLNALEFPPLLLAHDATGVPFREARAQAGVVDIDDERRAFHIRIRGDEQGIVR